MYLGDNIGYLGLRDSLENLSGSLPSNHPCKTCTIPNICCRPNVPVFDLDVRYIQGGIDSRKIEPQIIWHAHERLISKPKVCPFLNGDKRCTIYKHRPITCIEVGAGAIPLKKKLPDVNEFVGKNENVPSHLLGGSLCKQGAQTAIYRNINVPPEAIIHAGDLARLVHSRMLGNVHTTKDLPTLLSLDK
jgi:hypothetical protein